MIKQKSPTKTTVKAFPFYEFPQRIWRFIRYPSRRLLAKPLWHYIARYYNKTFSFILLIIVIGATLWINKHASFGFGNLIINKSEFCKQLYEVKRKSGEIPPSVDAECFIGKCMESNPKK